MEEENKEYEIERSGTRNLKFSGRIIASATTRDNRSTRWSNYNIYQTARGKYVFASAEISMWEGETGSYDAEVYTSPQEIFEKEGGRVGFEILKDLARQLNYDLSKHID